MTMATAENPTDGHPDDLDDRTRRALTEYMTVRHIRGDIYAVTGEGKEYRVDVREDRCTCPDHDHRGVVCKHIRRVKFATGAVSMPDGIEPVGDWTVYSED